MFPQIRQNNIVSTVRYTIQRDYEVKAPTISIVQATSTDSELLEKLFKLLDDISNNISLFKKTRQEVREEYPELFKLYGSTATTQ